MLPYLLTLSKIRYFISKKVFYTLGSRIASHPFLILFSYLFFILHISYPIVFDPSPSQHTVKNYIDGHLWQATHHLNYLAVDNPTLNAGDKPPLINYIAEQIILPFPGDGTTHLLNVEQQQQAFKNLLTASLSLYKSITISNQLKSVCALTPQRQCIVHSPFSLWNYDEQELQNDKNISNTINSHMLKTSKITNLPLHPATFMGNVTLDESSQQFTSANSIILTFILKNTEHTLDIWNQIWNRAFKAIMIHPSENAQIVPLASIATDATIKPYLVQYKLKVLPAFSLNRASTIILLTFGVTLFIFVRKKFTKSKLLKSHSGLGVAALFLSGSCYTLTFALLQHSTSANFEDACFLMLTVCISTTVEHMLLITQAVVAREKKDIRINNRVGKGLQQVGVQMTTTLLGELLILAIGSTMKQNSAYIKSFCLFTSTALVLGYILCLTLYIAILSIDIRRAELADLANHEHENEPVHYESEETLSYFYAQQYHERLKNKSRRAFNALLLCAILLILHFHAPSSAVASESITFKSLRSLAIRKQYNAISRDFWSTLNPNYSPTTLQVCPPHIVATTFSNDMSEQEAQESMKKISTYYSDRFSNVLYSMRYQHDSQQHGFDEQQPYCYTFLDSLHPLLLIRCIVDNTGNIPILILYIKLIGILLWMIPPVRERLLSPLLHALLLRISKLLSYTFLPRFLIKLNRMNSMGNNSHHFIGVVGSGTGSSSSSLDKNSTQSNSGNSHNGSSIHLGAISLQSQFNKRQNLDNIHQVKIKTLLGMHVADLNMIHSTDRFLVSVGQDNKLVLWDVATGQWLARLNKLNGQRCREEDDERELWFADAQQPRKDCFNSNGNSIRTKATATAATPDDGRVQRCLPHPRCAQLSLDNKFVVAGFENGAVCVWDTITLQLKHELMTKKRHQRQQQHSRVLHVKFLDHQTFISVHKDNSLQEWNAKTGQLIDCIEDTGHIQNISHVYTLPNSNSNDSYQGQEQLVWTASSKEGLVKCWKRRDVSTEKSTVTRWQNLYSITIPHCVTSVAADQLQDGSGILVLGSIDGAVRVYDYISGALVNTLSRGGYIKKKERDAEVGGPLLKFSTVAMNDSEPSMNKYSRYGYEGHISSSLLLSFDQQGSSQQSLQQQRQLQLGQNEHCNGTVIFDHQDAISQVVVTPIRVPGFENDTCPQCKTTLSLGFFVASCSLDESVHVWRLINTTATENGCGFCAKKNYYRHSALKQAATAAKNDNSNVCRRKKSSVGTTLRQRLAKEDMAASSSVACQQSQCKGQLLQPLFLGKLSQLGGRGLVFCDNMVLAGLRRTVKQQHHYASEESFWEVWFTSLQYYEPPSLTTEDTALIPVISYDLEKDENYYYPLQQQMQQEEEERMREDLLKKRNKSCLWEQFLLKFFGIKKVASTKKTADSRFQKSATTATCLRKNPPSSDCNFNSNYTSLSSYQPSNANAFNINNIPEQDDTENEDDVDAYEVLPFSLIQHATSTDGRGLSCDYGNFIKIISFATEG
ncbi:hypothetical protein BDF20DRAFT_838641 [Mycotypha africana]|uniref:uncharacterized protein n=1 Tax=Mycotypha africana TaxID=64632 RepID=UPI002301F982|nr:uncharacterized protein BDF20DRAFT_838641 [Mycotypha africana]KAI8970270.1 hypothetical protein BDF20DRAFT_838641 [Mycotypha africana]